MPVSKFGIQDFAPRVVSSEGVSIWTSKVQSSEM